MRLNGIAQPMALGRILDEPAFVQLPVVFVMLSALQ